LNTSNDIVQYKIYCKKFDILKIGDLTNYLSKHGINKKIKKRTENDMNTNHQSEENNE